MKQKEMKWGTMKTIAASVITMGLFFGTAISAHAATDVSIEAKPTAINVTVPTTSAMVFNEDGTNTVPTNFRITNNSAIGGVHIESIDLDAKTSGWSLLPENADLTKQTKNQKQVKLTFDTKSVIPAGADASKGTATFGASDFTIAANEAKTLTFAVERGAFTTAQASAKAFDMTMNFDFN